MPYKIIIATLAIVVATSAVALKGIGWLFGAVGVGDVVSFFGALLGTGLAVLGAVYIEDRKKQQAAADEIQPIEQALADIARCADRLVQAGTYGEMEDKDLLAAVEFHDTISGYVPAAKTRARHVAQDAFETACAYLQSHSLHQARANRTFHSGEPLDTVTKGVFADIGNTARQLSDALRREYGLPIRKRRHAITS